MAVHRLTALAALLIPTVLAAAQATRPAAVAGKRPATTVTPTANLGVVRDALKQLDLPKDERDKVDGILGTAQSDLRDAARDMVKADPADRPAMFKEMGKISDDAKAQVEAELTADQKTAYAKRTAELSVELGRKQIAGIKTATGKMDLTDDEKADVGAAVDKATKAMDDLGPAVKAVADVPAATEVQREIGEAGVRCQRELLHTLGHDKFTDLERTLLRQRIGKRPPTSRPAE